MGAGRTKQFDVSNMTEQCRASRKREFLLQEQIDKFEEAADGINADMALAEKALKVRRCFVGEGVNLTEGRE